MTPSDPTTVPLPADLLAAEEQMLQACLAAISSGDGRRWSASLRFENLRLLPVAVRLARGLIAKGQQVVPLQNLQPWGEAVSLFAQQRQGEVLAWLETGASAESQRWWRHTYPQLVWEPEGPLAPR